MDTTQALLSPAIFKGVIVQNIQSYHPLYMHDILFYVILFLVILAGFTRLAYNQEFGEVFTVFKSVTLSYQLQRNRSAALSMAFNWLNVIFVISVSLFYYQLAQNTAFARQVGFIWLAPIVTGGVILFLVFRLGFQRVVGSLFNLNKEISQYIFNVMQVNRITGLLLIPANIVVMFVQPRWQLVSIILSVLMLLTLMIYRYYLGYIIGKNRFRGSFFHFLLYICTLEIAPAAIVIKLIVQRM